MFNTLYVAENRNVSRNRDFNMQVLLANAFALI